jgi:hypothetical protein
MKRNVMTRKQVYKEIDLERDYQKKIWPSGNGESVGAELALLQAYVTKALAAYAENPGDTPALAVIRKITALGVRVLEKNGCPRRQRLKRVLG